MSDTGGGLECADCGRGVERGSGGAGPAGPRCPNCEGPLVPVLDVPTSAASAVREAWPAASLWAFQELLPVDATSGISMGEGATPLVECRWVAEELGVERVLVKDEGQNPTGTAADRGLSLAVTVARERGASAVALPSTGTDAVAAAAYGARAGLDVHAFVPTRSSHATKALVNVHGGDMTVVEGRLPDAVAAYEAAAAEAGAEEPWAPLAPGAAPLRVAGAATLLVEVLAAQEWAAPDAVVVPTGHGVGVVGAARVAAALREAGVIDEVPALYAAQAAGCAPIADAAREGAEAVQRVEQPDTIAGDLEVPDPAYGDAALAAVRESGGDAVAVADDAILEGACSIAAADGLEVGVAGGAAAAAAAELADDGALGPDAEVVLVNPVAGSLDSDVLRSHLMRQGI